MHGAELRHSFTRRRSYPVYRGGGLWPLSFESDFEPYCGFEKDFIA